MPNTNTVLTNRSQGTSITEVNPARPSGSIGPGNVIQYGGGNSAAENQQTETSITPAGPYISKGTNNSIIGTVPPGKAGLPQISTVKQNATDLKCGIASVGGSSNMADNWLPASTATVKDTTVPGAGAGGNVTPNAAQLDSAGSSLSPAHE